MNGLPSSQCYPTSRAASLGARPLGILAHRTGSDTIDAALGLAQSGISLKVASGLPPAREAATQAISDNQRKGCIVDLLAFWTAWKLDCLDVIRDSCGRFHVSRSVIDQLRARR